MFYVFLWILFVTNYLFFYLVTLSIIPIFLQICSEIKLFHFCSGWNCEREEQQKTYYILVANTFQCHKYDQTFPLQLVTIFYYYYFKTKSFHPINRPPFIPFHYPTETAVMMMIRSLKLHLKITCPMWRGFVKQSMFLKTKWNDPSYCVTQLIKKFFITCLHCWCSFSSIVIGINRK